MPGWVRGTPLQLCEGAQKPSSLCKISREKCCQGWSDPERTVCPADVACGEIQQAVTEGSGHADVRIHRAGKWGPGTKPGLCRLQGSRTSSPQGGLAAADSQTPSASTRCRLSLSLLSLSARTVHTGYFEGIWEKMWGFFYPLRAPRSTYRVIWGEQGKMAPSSGGL